jgi:hypothetical protein
VTLEEALTTVTNVCYAYHGNHRDHVLIAEALEVIGAAVARPDGVEVGVNGAEADGDRV